MKEGHKKRTGNRLFSQTKHKLPKKFPMGLKKANKVQNEGREKHNKVISYLGVLFLIQIALNPFFWTM